MTHQHLPDDPRPSGPSERPHSPHSASRMTRTTRGADHCPPEGSAHLLFGSVEELLADLAASGEPEGGVVRVERLVRTQPTALGGDATLGIAVTARRANELSEVLSAWVIIARMALDPRGHPLAIEQAQEAARRHHEAQRLISAQIADAGYAPRSGMHLLSDGCYAFTATAAPLATATPAAAPAEHAGEQGGSIAEGPGNSEADSEGGAAHA